MEERKDADTIDDEYSRKVAELVKLISELPPDRLEQLRRELEAEKGEDKQP